MPSDHTTTPLRTAFFLVAVMVNSLLGAVSIETVSLLPSTEKLTPLILALKSYLESTLLESVRVVVYLIPFHSSSIVFAEPEDLLQKLGTKLWF